MNLVGVKVISRAYGAGVVSAQEGNKLSIDFSAKSSKFEYKQETFTKFLVAEDPVIQEALIR